MSTIQGGPSDQVANLPVGGAPTDQFQSDLKLTTASIHDFKMMMKHIAKHDLWDVLESELAAAGVTAIRLGAEPVRLIASAVQRGASSGRLAVLPPEVVACACVRSHGSGGSDAGTDAGSCGGGAVMPEGSSCST